MSTLNCAAAPLLRLDGATLQLDQQVFGPFDVTLRAGERVAILGPSGAGKSTLLKLMARELAPAAGAIELDGKALGSWKLAELAGRRALLAQSSEVGFGLQVELVIALGRVARLHDPQLDAIVDAAAALAHAGHLLGRRLDTLSGGEQARVQLARLFAQLWDTAPGLILVDEPLAALDPGLQFDLLDSLESYAQARGHAVVAILHDINHALSGFRRLLLVKQGRLCGDLASDADALPALEALYRIGLSRALDADGRLSVIAVRRHAL